MSQDDKHQHHIDAAPTRHPELFKVAYALRDLLSDWIDSPGFTERPKTALGVVRYATALRGWNLFKAVVPLLERDLWEDAVILIRSTFELVLNIEHVEQVEAEREKRARRFFRYQELQEYQQMVARYQYAVHTGRTLANDPAMQKLHDAARKLFPEFIGSQKNGDIRWAKSWCGKNVWELAKGSPQSIREWQYKLLYAYTSSFVHATPVAVLSTFRWRETEVNWSDFVAKQIATDYEQLLMATSLLLSFTLELMMLVGGGLPKFSPVAVMTVFDQMYALWGIEPPTKRKVGPTEC